MYNNDFFQTRLYCMSHNDVHYLYLNVYILNGIIKAIFNEKEYLFCIICLLFICFTIHLLLNVVRILNCLCAFFKAAIAPLVCIVSAEKSSSMYNRVPAPLENLENLVVFRKEIPGPGKPLEFDVVMENFWKSIILK